MNTANFNIRVIKAKTKLAVLSRDGDLAKREKFINIIGEALVENFATLLMETQIYTILSTINTRACVGFDYNHFALHRVVTNNNMDETVVRLFVKKLHERKDLFGCRFVLRKRLDKENLLPVLSDYIVSIYWGDDITDADTSLSNMRSERDVIDEETTLAQYRDILVLSSENKLDEQLREPDGEIAAKTLAEFAAKAAYTKTTPPGGANRQINGDSASTNDETPVDKE